MYKEELKVFRKCTTLKLFCQAQKKKGDDPPPGFRKLVAKHSWPDTITLEVVELFRQSITNHHDLRSCAMMLHTIGIGSFTVTWFVPLCVAELLRKKRAVKVLEHFNVDRLELLPGVAGCCVYEAPEQHIVS